MSFSTHGDHDDLRGVTDPDFLALGLGGTNMMAMLWSVAMGRRAVGVEMRGDPSPGASWNIAADTYHQLGRIDRMMLERYGEDRLPRRGDGRLLRLAECFHKPGAVTGTIAVEEVINCFFDFDDEELKIAGDLEHIEHLDDRWVDGAPRRIRTLRPTAAIPDSPDPDFGDRDLAEVLKGPHPFQVSAAELLTLMRRYLEALEAMDLADPRCTPRVRLFSEHRVASEADGGIEETPEGRLRIRIEALHELDYRGTFAYVRKPGTPIIDLGVPELFMIAQGPNSSDATRLGFKRHEVEVDRQDGRPPVPARADFVAILLSMHATGRFRYRIASEFDDDGNEYWVRQMLLGHENDPEVGWVLVQVPDYLTFDPIAAGLVPADVDTESPEFFAAYQLLLKEFLLDRAEEILEMPRRQIEKINTFYGPKLVHVEEHAGTDARVAVNGVVAGDTFGNGHFINSGDSITGMVGHSRSVRRYWERRDEGAAPDAAIRELADGISRDTRAWLDASAVEFTQPVQPGIDPAKLDEARRTRAWLASLDLSDWNRLLVHAGRLHTDPLPPAGDRHPADLGLGWTKRRGRRVVALLPSAVNAEYEA
uniref:Putative component of transmembrane efflux complex n=1 Tax=Streptomyces tenjimariensis TaxID=29308 RepID=Q2UZD5_9ACTN|nr:putative component of transmembrane efflux complex [Streptomyces tenjimariensis]